MPRWIAFLIAMTAAPAAAQVVPAGRPIEIGTSYQIAAPTLGASGRSMSGCRPATTARRGAIRWSICSTVRSIRISGM
ncbi:hypothetical protein [uncultured Sphingomonas sp.]|uniref:hypothetical protein n=1 Tax=uncultured Sphingomonas sp. TaxID=158754 RepID=UPI0025D3F12F|nr:hypothetical protein [uncultured Sphingomonas sp.]